MAANGRKLSRVASKGLSTSRRDNSVPCFLADGQLRTAGFSVELEIEPRVGHTISLNGADKALGFLRRPSLLMRSNPRRRASSCTRSKGDLGLLKMSPRLPALEVVRELLEVDRIRRYISRNKLTVDPSILEELGRLTPEEMFEFAEEFDDANDKQAFFENRAPSP